MLKTNLCHWLIHAMMKETYLDMYNFLLQVARMLLQYHENDYNAVLLSLKITIYY